MSERKKHDGSMLNENRGSVGSDGELPMLDTYQALSALAFHKNPDTVKYLNVLEHASFEYSTIKAKQTREQLKLKASTIALIGTLILFANEAVTAFNSGFEHNQLPLLLISILVLIIVTIESNYVNSTNRITERLTELTIHIEDLSHPSILNLSNSSDFSVERVVNYFFPEEERSAAIQAYLDRQHQRAKDARAKRLQAELAPSVKQVLEDSDTDTPEILDPLLADDSVVELKDTSDNSSSQRKTL